MARKAGGMTPLAIDLFCGLGGWTEGLMSEGYRVVGFDMERHRYPRYELPELTEGQKGSQEAASSDPKKHKQRINRMRDALKYSELVGWQEYPAQLVIQDVLTIHGRQFKDAALIVASPPCQEYSYMAMPWSIAKQKAKDYESGVRDVKQLTALFDACFRIQREACEAAGHHIPLVVENVRGAQRWVGRSRYHFGSFHLWGDVPALMPMVRARAGAKNDGGSWFNIGSPGQKEVNRNPVHKLARDCGHEAEGNKGANDGWFNDAKRKGGTETGRLSQSGSKSPARKAASAAIAKIPFVLACWVARAWKPQEAA